MQLFVCSNQLLCFYSGRLSLQQYLYQKSHNTVTQCITGDIMVSCTLKTAVGQPSFQLTPVPILLLAGLQLTSVLPVLWRVLLLHLYRNTKSMVSETQNKEYCKRTSCLSMFKFQPTFLHADYEMTTKARVFIGTNLFTCRGQPLKNNKREKWRRES